MITKASKVTAPETAKAITEARISPTQGVQTRPIDSPIIIPPPNPSRRTILGLGSLEKRDFIKSCVLGNKYVIPNIRITVAAKNRSDSAGKLKVCTSQVKKRVKIVKLPINPMTTPKGLLLPVWVDSESTIGRTGKIQGDRIVTTPAINAKITKIIILT